MIIAIGSDHRGVEMKTNLIGLLNKLDFQIHDVGAYDLQRVDYPDIALKVCQLVISGTCERGILICGTGLGMSIAANKIEGIRAALCNNVFLAKRSRQHNNSNILCLGAEKTLATERIVKAFLSTSFEGGHHQQRIDKISAIEALPTIHKPKNTQI